MMITPRHLASSIAFAFVTGGLATPSPTFSDGPPVLSETQKLTSNVPYEIGNTLAANGTRFATGGDGYVFWLRWDPAMGWVDAGNDQLSFGGATYVALDEDEAVDSSDIEFRVYPWTGSSPDLNNPYLNSGPSPVTAVAIDGSRVAVGKADFQGSGLVTTYVRDLQGNLVFEDNLGGTFSGQLFGAAVDLQGNTLVVGAPANGTGTTGLVFVFGRSNGQWALLDTLTAPPVDPPLPGSSVEPRRTAPRGSIPQPELDNAFGSAVAISGSWIAAGAPLEDTAFPQPVAVDAGAVSLFEHQFLGNYVRQETLFGLQVETGARHGSSVALDGKRLVVGAPGEDVGSFPFGVLDVGAAYAYAVNEGLWSLVAKLTASDRFPSDQFGTSVALPGNGVLVGAPFAEGLNNVADVGAVYSFERVFGVFADGFESGNTSAWSQTSP